MANKLYLLNCERYHGDCDIPDIVGIWDNPQNLLGYFNELRKAEFERQMKDAKNLEKEFYTGGDFFTTYRYHVTEFEPNIGYNFDQNTLTYAKIYAEDTPFQYRVYNMEEFFDEMIFPKMWGPDYDLIEKHNKKIKTMKAKEYTGKSLSKKMREFKSLLKDLKEHGVLEGEFFMIRRENNDPLNKVNEGEDNSW